MPEIRFEGVELAVPEELAGFGVETFLATYPPNAGRSHRKAVYVRLTPLEPKLIERIRAMGKSKILAAGEIDAQTYALLREHQLSEADREAMVRDVLAEALLLSAPLRA